MPEDAENRDILKEIMASKMTEVAELGSYGHYRFLMATETPPPPRDFAAALRLPGRVAIIAEVKKASPSRGVLRRDFNPAALARTYAENGAAAISVLTERFYFLGDWRHLKTVRSAVDIPVLRKDFIFCEEQVAESRLLGADAILLIAAVLRDDQLERLLEFADQKGLQCLVEVHDEKELERAVSAGACIIGINNRDLWTFETDLSVTERLAPMVPQGCTIVSESGIQTPEDIERVRQAGVHAVLIGEALVREEDPGVMLRTLAAASSAVVPGVVPGASPSGSGAGNPS